MDFIKAWPYQNIFDTKVSSYCNKDYFEKNTLSALYETTETSDKFKGILGFKFDEKHEMIKYMPAKPKPTVEAVPTKLPEGGVGEQNGGSAAAEKKDEVKPTAENGKNESVAPTDKTAQQQKKP